MTPADRGELVGLAVGVVCAAGGGLLGHAGQPVLADRVEHAVAGALAGRGQQQAVLREAGEAGLHRRLAVRPGLGPVRVAGHRRRRLGRERGGEDRHPSQQGLVGGVEQAVAPVDGRAQRLVALVDPGPARQQVESLAEAPLDAVEAERGQPGRGQLDGEGAAVEAPADVADASPVGRRERGGAGLPRPLEEQRHRVALVALAGERQAGDGEHPLERQHQPGLGRGEHGDAWAPAEQPLDEHAHPGDEVLAVVEHEQGLVVGQVGEDVVLARPARRVGQPERPAHRRGDERLVGDRHQVDEPHAVAPAVGHRAGDRRGQAGLAHAPGPERGHQPVRLDRGHEAGDLGRPPHERGEGDGHRAGRRGRGGGAVVRPRAVGSGPVVALVDAGARAERVRHAGEGPAVGHVELAEQRGHVALDRAHRDEQAGRDLRVGGPLGHELEHLGLALGHAGVDQRMSFRHFSSLPVRRPHRV